MSKVFYFLLLPVFLIPLSGRAESMQESFDKAREFYVAPTGGREANEKKAFVIFEKIAPQGHMGAKFYLGEIFETGRAGKAVDMKVAETHYRAAAAGCYEHALHVLNTSFLVPTRDLPVIPALVAIDHSKIDSNYQGIYNSFVKEGKNGDLCAMRATGFAVLKGLERMRASLEGWKPDAAQQKQGMELLKKAAEAGLPWAQDAYANVLDGGLGGVTVDTVGAKLWRKRAADAGFAVSKK